MKQYGVNELRRMFLEFFESKGHLAMKSFSLVPHNDNSLLLINSGMAPLKPYFTGQEIPPRRRVTTCQKCIRTGDIENIGKTARHGTFFEMLGNFSFGDYFKRDAIRWSWEFLTEVVGLDADRLYPSVYLEDDEAFDIWNKEIGIAPERIFRFGKEDNFWEHGSGPCGGKNTAAASRAAPWAATATAISKCGTMYLPSLTMTAKAITANWSKKISTPAWGWSVWRPSCRMWTLFLTWIRSRRFGAEFVHWRGKNIRKNTNGMYRSVS